MNLFEFFSKLFKKSSNNTNDYTGAGCMFINVNKTLVLSGYQPNKKSISGFGGKKEKNECYHQTAIRELFEELFNISHLSDNILNEIYEIIPLKIQYTNNYVNLIFSFDQLTNMLEILDYYKIKSNLYNTFPICLTELILNRNNQNSEILHLCLLPNINTKIKINKDFINDIKLLHL